MEYVFRVECSEGDGPFNGSIGIRTDLGIRKHSGNKAYPNIRQDSDDFTEDYFCSCPTACSFLHWFGEHIDIILANYSVYRIGVKSRIIGKSGHQSIYLPQDIIEKTKLYTN